MIAYVKASERHVGAEDTSASGYFTTLSLCNYYLQPKPSPARFHPLDLRQESRRESMRCPSMSHRHRLKGSPALLKPLAASEPCTRFRRALNPDTKGYGFWDPGASNIGRYSTTGWLLRAENGKVNATLIPHRSLG